MLEGRSKGETEGRNEDHKVCKWLERAKDSKEGKMKEVRKRS